MALIKIQNISVNNLWKTKYSNPNDITLLFSDPIITELYTAWNICDPYNININIECIRKEWKNNNIYELEIRSGILCAYKLGHFWMKICDDLFNDQTLIWFKRGYNLIFEAGLMSNCQEKIERNVDKYEIKGEKLLTFRIFKKK
eukprot:100092_1